MFFGISDLNCILPGSYALELYERYSFLTLPYFEPDSYCGERGQIFLIHFSDTFFVCIGIWPLTFFLTITNSSRFSFKKYFY